VDVALSNQNTTLVRDDIDVKEIHLTAICDLLAYKLQANVNYNSFIQLDSRGKEFLPPLGNVFEFSDSLVKNSVNSVAPLSANSRAITLYFMIRVGLAYVDIPYKDIDKKNVVTLLRELQRVEQPRDLEILIREYNICPVSPLMYTRLANDILKKANVELGDLKNPPLIGLLLESYIKGEVACKKANWNLTSYKVGEGKNEIDLVDTSDGVLCEITVSNKRLRDVHLNKHFIDEPYLRVLATKDIEDFVDGIHRVPYPKLCMMFDKNLVNNSFLQNPKPALTPSSIFS